MTPAAWAVQNAGGAGWRVTGKWSGYGVLLLEYPWLFYLPLLFLPNLGLARPTAFGRLEISDFLIWGYLSCLLLARRSRQQVAADRLAPPMLAFLAWALVSTLTIPFRYDYTDNRALYFSMLKVAKLTLYGLAGWLTVTRVGGAFVRRLYHWSLLGVIAMLGISLLTLRPERDPRLAAQAAAEGYKANNAISVGIAFLACYLGALWIAGYGDRLWRRAAVAAIALGLTGSFVSSGRGGWVAALAGVAYIIMRRRGARTAVVFLVLVALSGVFAYHSFPEFRKDVDRTLSPDPRYLQKYGSGILGIDEGGRLGIWRHAALKLVNAPLLGTGFFHRGGPSGLSTTGSHNFFIQMFLETGVVGGLLVLAIFRRMWLDAGSREARIAGLGLPLRAALVAAVVGGMGGEYFYGGTVLLALLSVYAPVGGLPRLEAFGWRRAARRQWADTPRVAG